MSFFQTDTNKSTDHPKFGEKYNQNDLGNFEMHMDFRASQEEYNYEVRPEVSPGQLYTDEEFPLSVAMGKDYNQELLKWKRPFVSIVVARHTSVLLQ